MDPIGLILDLLVNLCASFIFLFLLAGIGWLLLGRRKRKLHRFFGINRKAPLIVYLSAMGAEKDTLKDRHGHTTQHEGVVISDYEFHTMLPISNLFLSDFLGTIPHLLADLIEQATEVQKPNINFEVSPQEYFDLKFSSMICVGSELFNSATAYYWDKALPILRLHLDPETDKWAMQRFVGEEIVQTVRPDEVREFAEEEDRWNIGVITKSVDTRNGNTVFIVAGTGKNGTRAAVYCLIQSWQEFEKEFKGQEFGVAIKCIKYPFDPYGYKEFQEIGRWTKC